MSADITVVMMTIDRTPRPNYLGKTLHRFSEAGVFYSPRLHSMHIIDSGTKKPLDYFDAHLPKHRSPKLYIHCGETRNTRENVAKTMWIGSATGTKWVLFCEDDIDVCASFLDSVGRWLDEHEREDRRVYAFGAAYDQIKTLHRMHQTVWDYPITAFYGTQCIALRSEDAKSYSEYMTSHPLVRGENAPQAYDIAMQDWAREQWPDYKFFSASVPNFVQHLGSKSSLGSKFFTFPAWPGPEWTYAPPVRVLVP
jgi:hypothetical protein